MQITKQGTPQSEEFIAKVQGFKPVLSPLADLQFQRLWALIWKVQDDAMWRRSGDSAFELYVHWWWNKGIFSVQKVFGKLPEPYYIESCGSTMKLALRERVYVFSSNPEYGSLRQPGTIYLKTTHSGYFNRSSDQSKEEFSADPEKEYGWVESKLWAMTEEAEAEAVAMLSDLCDRIDKSLELMELH